MALFSNQVLSQFGELDYEVYNFILKNSDKIPYMTIREVAKEAHVSTTTNPFLQESTMQRFFRIQGAF